MGKELKRMNYFDGLLLKAEDYGQDKDYIRRLQGFHNRYLHTWGIICGLEVRPVIDSSMEVLVTEGAALDLVDEKSGADVKESTSRQILIYEGHPDNPLDLSEYDAGDNIYISVSYCETGADRDNEKGQGGEIHIWERGQLSHSSTKPADIKKNVLLARVVPKIVRKETENSDGSSIVYDEVIIDSTCIFDTDTDGTPLRVYAGPYARVLELKKFIFKFGDKIDGVPFVNAAEQVTSSEKQLDMVSKMVNFSGEVEIDKDLWFQGQLVSKKDGKPTPEFETEENILQVNSINVDKPELWIKRDGGLEVFRGGSADEPDARIVWSDEEERWLAGTGLDLSPIAHGADWDKMINKSFADKHGHSRLFSSKGAVLEVESSGAVSSKAGLSIPQKILISPGNSIEALAWYGKGRTYSGMEVEGPALSGFKGGLLGTAENGQKAVLSWNSNKNVGIGTVNPGADMLDVAGSVRLLSKSNPVRFTSEWTAFPDLTTNQAEICNDTTYHKALMIVGNQSAGQGRKVAIWDRLDVAGLLYVNGSMQLSQALNVTAGSGSNKGIVFPNDPGGGSGDSAWIKYYPRSGEACTLEIGVSNDADDNISIMSAGGTGIGTTAPNDSLDSYGYTRIMSNSNPLRFTSVWSGFTELSSKNAEISNDTGTYKTLMIVGNRSAGQERKVSVWDRLDVNGSLKVTGNLAAKGAIIPGVGNCDVKGLMWPRDPYGGSGDAAWIRYYSDALRGGGHNMTLEIGIANDSNLQSYTSTEFVSTCPYSWVKNPCGYYRTISYTYYGTGGDRLRLYASGGTYVDGNLYYTSTKEYKENIKELSKSSAQSALNSLEPVEFNFKGDSRRTTMGFIAEEVPEVFAASDKKAVSPVEILAVLVSEVKEQEKILNKLKKKVAALKALK